MSVIALNGDGLTATDISALTGLSYKLSAEGLAGACVPATMDDGQRMVAILNPDNEAILFGVAKVRAATSSSTGMVGRWWRLAPVSMRYCLCSNNETCKKNSRAMRDAIQVHLANNITENI